MLTRAAQRMHQFARQLICASGIASSLLHEPEMLPKSLRETISSTRPKPSRPSGVTGTVQMRSRPFSPSKPLVGVPPVPKRTTLKKSVSATQAASKQPHVESKSATKAPLFSGSRKQADPRDFRYFTVDEAKARGIKMGTVCKNKVQQRPIDINDQILAEVRAQNAKHYIHRSLQNKSHPPTK